MQRYSGAQSGRMVPDAKGSWCRSSDVDTLRNAIREVVGHDGGCVDINWAKPSRFCADSKCPYCILQRFAGFTDATE